MKSCFVSFFLFLFLMQCSTRRESTEASEESATFVELTPEQSQEWVNRNLDSVMLKKNFSASNGLVMPYRLFISPAYDGKSPLPLLIHLHGRGERGTDNRPEIYNKLPLFNGPNAIVTPNTQHQFPCIILVPQCSDKTINEEWAKWEGNTPETPFKGLGKDGSYTMAENPSESGAAVLELIDSVIHQFNINTKRVYLTGTSMGGFGTWEYVGRRPELWAAAVPMAGYSDPSMVDRIKHIPFWIFHGGADTVNPPEGSRTMYKLLKENGAEVNYTEYSEAEHSPAFQQAWKEPALLSWIFSQEKNHLNKDVNLITANHTRNV